MANEEHLAIIRKGTEAWNQWRIDHPEIQPHLRDARFKDVDLGCVNFCEADLSYTSFSNANLKSAYLSGAYLFNADLSNANLIRTFFSNANLKHAKLKGAKLKGAYFKSADLDSADLSDADLSYADLTDSNLDNVDLRHAKLYNTILRNVTLRNALLNNVDLSKKDLRGTDLTGATLTDANLGGAVLSRVILNNADLRRTNLTEADLSEADLSQADLGQSDLNQANLFRSNLSGANLLGANLAESLIGYSSFVNMDLSTIRGLDTVRHQGPCSIGIDTIFRSGGNIPESFLKGTGVPDTIIAYLVSLAVKAFDFHSCFISYSSKDHPFAQRLHADLQRRSVRCWFAPEDLKIGDKIRSGIDESIPKYEKLLLILSQNSISSRWVEKEVEVALEHEEKQNRIILFPIRLDDVVMGIQNGWPADIRRTRNIGDFKGWTNLDSYQKAFDRLMRDLKA